MFTSLQIKFLILIAMVFVITLGFAILIWRQTYIIEKKAMAAKQRQKEYQNLSPLDQTKGNDINKI